MGIIFFGFVTVTLGMLLLVALPAVLLAFAPGMRTPVKLFWVLLSLLPIAAMAVLSHHALPVAYFLYPEWAIYFFYLWIGRGPSRTRRRPQRRIGLGLATTAFLCVVAWTGFNVYGSAVEAASMHEVFWPLDGSGTRYARLRMPAHFGGGWLQSADSANAAMPAGTPDLPGEISSRLLWPTLATRTYDNEEEFGGFAPHVLTVDFKVLNRFSSDEHPVNRLACNFEIATNELGKDCFVVSTPHLEPLTNLAPRYGLARRGLVAPLKPGGPFVSDVWLALADDGTLETMIECPRDGEASIHASCKQSFEVRPLNAIVEVSFNHTYLPLWKDIKEALTKTLLRMKG